MLQTQGLKSIEDIRAFLAGSQAVEIKPPQREVSYAFIAESFRSPDLTESAAIPISFFLIPKGGFG